MVAVAVPEAGETVSQFPPDTVDGEAENGIDPDPTFEIEIDCGDGAAPPDVAGKWRPVCDSANAGPATVLARVTRSFRVVGAA